MAREIFIDSNAWVALVDSRDNLYAAATAVYHRRLRQWSRWITTNLVIAESYILILHRSDHTHALRFLTKMRSISNLVIVYSSPDSEAQAEAILRRYADQDFSFTDAVSFAVMRQRGIADAFSFDHHFLTAGFALVPAGPTGEPVK